MPTSVLLAVLAAAGLLALAPALVRRYDATERLAAERVQSTARVLNRERRRRTVPGPRPLYAPRLVAPAPDPPAVVSALQMATVQISMVPALRADDVIAGADSAAATTVESGVPIGRAVWLPIAGGRPGGRIAARGGRATVRPSGLVPRGRVGGRRGGARRSSGDGRSGTGRGARPRVRQSPAVYRRRRVLASLVVFNAVELVGVLTVSPGFWTGFAVTSLMLVGYVVHLRNEALEAARRHRVAARRAAVVAAVQAEIRAEQARRAAARKDALRRAAAARATAQREAVQLTQRYVDFDPARRVRVRGKSYETGGWDRRAVGL